MCHSEQSEESLVNQYDRFHATREMTVIQRFLGFSAVQEVIIILVNES